jgi:hypothetical protein
MDYMASCNKPMSPAQWDQLINAILERYRQIDNFMGRGQRLPVPLKEGEMEAYEGGVMSWIRWVGENPMRGGPEVMAMTGGISINVGLRPLAKVNYEPYG